LYSQKDIPGSHSETCASSSHSDQAVNIKVEEVSDSEDGEDPVPMTFVEIKAEREVSYMSLGEGTPRKMATAMQPQFLREVTDFKQATCFQISRCTLRKLMFE
jgi:hypothetical protein